MDPSQALRRALLSGRRRPRLIGVGSPLGRRGDGYEFAELREYQTGDDPRRIDWAATARVGDLQVRIFLEDVALVFAAIVDSSASMRVGRTVSRAESAQDAVRAWFEAAEDDDRCRRLIGGDLQPSGAMRGRASARACAEVAPAARFDLRRELDIATRLLPRGAALLVISDCFDLDDMEEIDRAEILRACGLRTDATVLFVRDPWPEGLPLRGFVRMRDAESGRLERVFIGRGDRARYRAAVRAREDAYRERFERAGWRFNFLEDDGRAALWHAFGIL